MGMYQGVNASEGIGIGTVMVAVDPDLTFEPHEVADSAAEKERYQSALSVFCEKTQAQADHMKETVGEAEAEIMSGHIVLAQDPGMTDAINAAIDGGTCAEQALMDTSTMFENMFLSIVKVVLVPIALGFVVNHFFHAFTQNAVRVLPLISTTAIVLIICAVVSANSAKIMTSGLLILAVVILHNLLGYLTGFGVGKLLKLDSTKCRAISIEVGMQNSGLATSLAAAHFAQYPLATIPGAVFSVWHNISGAVLANFFARTAEKKD